MERRTQFNLGYLVFALIAMLMLQQWWQMAQTIEVVPYSEFEKLLAEQRIEEVVITDQRTPQQSYDRMVTQLPRDRVLAPRLLNISRTPPRFAE